MQGGKWFLCAGAFLIVAVAMLWRLEEIYEALRALKIKLIEIYSRLMDKTTKISGWENKVFEDNSEWYCTETMIAHACGGNVRLSYTNSREALHQAIKDGFCVVECDVKFTKDDKIVCAHDFYEAAELPDYNVFLNSKIDGRFTPMDLNTCITIAREAGVTVIIDTKDRVALPKVAQWVQNNQQSFCVYIQIFAEEELETVRELPVLYNLTFTQDYERVAAFCLTNGIRVVSISKQRLQESMQWKILVEHNIKVFAHTVNSLEEYRQVRGWGASGVFTDFLITEDITGIEGKP